MTFIVSAAGYFIKKINNVLGVFTFLCFHTG